MEDSTHVVELFACDVGGQDVFIDCCEEHLPDTNYIMLVFNLFEPQTFQDCEDWLNLVLKSRKQTAEPLRGVLVGNKSDLNLSNRVDVDTASNWASSKGLEFFEVSSVSKKDRWAVLQSSCPPEKKHKTNKLTFFVLPQLPQGNWEAPFRHIAESFHAKYEDFLQRAASTRE